jgi:tetratricopeptide (TPR) repeat protein
MSKRKDKRRSPARPKRSIMPQQNARLQQALRAQAAGNLGFAEAEYRALAAERVRTPELYTNLGRICAGKRHMGEAREWWEKALAMDPGFVDAGIDLAESYQQVGKAEMAERIYQRLLAANPANVVVRYTLANLLKARGRHDEAAGMYRKIMQWQPDYTQAHFTFSQIHKYRDPSDPHIAEMLELYGKKSLPDGKRIHLAFALAKAFENLGQYDTAFGYLETGNRLRARQFNYDIEADRTLMRSIMQAFTAEAMANVEIDEQQSDCPIFIVGMPRSGTSLVEKIIASHSAVHGAGELDYIFALGASLFLRHSPDYCFMPLDRYPPSAFESFGKTYLEQIALLAKQARHVSDKMPFNMMMIGLIRMTLPNARIVHCVRDARDTCLSIYKQNFTTANYRFAYDLKATAQFHNQYRELMAHWHDVMPGIIHEVVYEDLTANPEQEIPKLLTACGLEFEEACLDFSRSEGLVRTASSWQVRQPMYTGSVRLWEKYGAHLQPMLDELDGT